jgi:hypothetical protein
MRKCSKTRFQPLQTLNNIIFEPMFLVVWKYAKMHQTRFLPLYTLKLQMRKNTFITTPYIKKYLFKNLILVVWKYA